MLWYAGGPARESTSAASTTFKKGYPLVFSDSALSGAPVSITSVTPIAGIAKADSDESFVDEQVPYLALTDQTTLWASAQSATFEYARGVAYDLIFAPPAGSSVSDWVVSSFSTTGHVRIDPNGSSPDVIDGDGARRVRVIFDPEYVLYRS